MLGFVGGDELIGVEGEGNGMEDVMGFYIFIYFIFYVPCLLCLFCILISLIFEVIFYFYN